MKGITKIRIGQITALTSFLLGTVLFLSYVITENDHLLFVGYFFIVIVGGVNLIVLLWLLFQRSEDKAISKGLNLSKLFIVANIPVAILYSFGIMIMLSYMRITFINKTGSMISNIRIIGCDDKSLSKMNPNEKTMKWIGINGDCSIDIKYSIGEIEYQESVIGYVSGLMGQRYQYKIGIDDGKF